MGCDGEVTGAIGPAFSFGVPGLEMVWRIVKCGTVVLPRWADEVFTFSGSTFTLEIGCQGDGLGAGVDDDGDGAAGRVGLRLACCCCFFLSFCDILPEAKVPEDLRSGGFSESPSDRFEVRDDDACCMISRIPSLFGVRIGACQGSLSFDGVSRGSGSKGEPTAGEGLSNGSCLGSGVPRYSTRFHRGSESLVARVGGEDLVALPCFDGVVWADSPLSSSSISNMRSEIEACPFNGGVFEGFGEPTIP